MPHLYVTLVVFYNCKIVIDVFTSHSVFWGQLRITKSTQKFNNFKRPASIVSLLSNLSTHVTVDSFNRVHLPKTCVVTMQYFLIASDKLSNYLE